MNRSECLDTAKDLITRERAKQYGGAYAMHQRVADMWNGYLSQDNLTLTVKDVAVMMILLKAARLRNVDTDKDPTVDGHDSFVDICGYAALGCELTSPIKD
jgi:hypothetical protein